jgi:hypothetical protein
MPPTVHRISIYSKGGTLGDLINMGEHWLIPRRPHLRAGIQFKANRYKKKTIKTSIHSPVGQARDPGLKKVARDTCLIFAFLASLACH